MTCAASHAFQVSSGRSGTIAAKLLKNEGWLITHSACLSSCCGLAHAIQSKPGMSCTSFATGYLLNVFDGVAALDARPLDAREVGFEREDELRVGLGVRPAREREHLLEVLADTSRGCRRSAGRCSGSSHDRAVPCQTGRGTRATCVGSPASASTKPLTGPPMPIIENLPSSSASSAVVFSASTSAR